MKTLQFSYMETKAIVYGTLLGCLKNVDYIESIKRTTYLFSLPEESREKIDSVGKLLDFKFERPTEIQQLKNLVNHVNIGDVKIILSFMREAVSLFFEENETILSHVLAERLSKMIVDKRNSNHGLHLTLKGICLIESKRNDAIIILKEAFEKFNCFEAGVVLLSLIDRENQIALHNKLKASEIVSFQIEAVDYLAKAYNFSSEIPSIASKQHIGF